MKHFSRSSPAGIDAARYREAMQHHASGVAVVATGVAGQRHGMTATAIAALSAEPPMLLACLQRSSGSHRAILDTGAFSVNLLASDAREIAERFAGQTGLKGESRFEGLPWSTLASGAPVLDTAIAVLDCRLQEAKDVATHSIFIGQVVAVAYRGEAQPLLYFRRGYHELGVADES